jgi:hypothetical protein
MAIAERPFMVKRSLNIRGPSENTRLAFLACGLLLFNILIGVMVHRALPNDSRAQAAEVILSHGD